jgi:hypothetical protein
VVVTVGCSSEGTGVVLGWRGLDGGGEVVEVLLSQWVAFRRFGDFVLLVFWWLGQLKVTRRCCGGEMVFRWHCVVGAVGLWLMRCLRAPTSMPLIWVV